jgi:hypothetical protein
MKIGEAHRTQSSSLYSANIIGAPMHPAPIGVADRTRKNISVRLAYFHDNHILTGHYKQETEILLRNDVGNIKK